MVSNNTDQDGPVAFVTGWPVKHSLSPIIHNHWLSIHGLKGSYRKEPSEPDLFPIWLTSLQKNGFVGGNVTIPHKEAAFELVQMRDETAKTLGAANTVWLENGVLWGGNTDGYGFLANHDDRAPGWDKDSANKTALVLGAGGASRAVIHGLQQRRFSKILIANRTLSRAEALAEKFGGSCKAINLEDMEAVTPNVQFVVNTTSLGMSGDKASPPIDVNALPSSAIVTDIVYTPLMTPFLAAAQAAGLRTVDGLGMLLHQAVPGFEKWFGVRPEVTPKLRNLLLEELGETAERSETVFLGLTGSIGMGKSTTAQMFRDAGIPVHDADATVHRLYEGEAVPLVEAEFPGSTKNGAVDRTALSKFVVGNEEAMKRLEAIVHPLVHCEELTFRARVEKEGSSVALLDAPLLFEMGTDQRVDAIVVVTAPADVQRARVLERPGMTEDKFEAILARQVPDAEKRQKADFIIDTSLGLEAARAEVQEIVDAVRQSDWLSKRRKKNA